MSRNNDVFQVLVTKGNQGLLAKDKKVTDLAPGQLGVFDFETGLSVASGQDVSTLKNFYFAVGLDTDGDGVTDDITKSAGSHIQGRNIQFYNEKPYKAPTPMKVVLKDYVADCETEYGFKLEFRNQEIYRTQGFVQFTKPYMIKTSCCNGCEPTCPSGDANEITKLLLINIANDPAGLITGKAIARQALVAATVTGLSGDIAKGEEVSDADLEVIMAYNATLDDTGDKMYTDIEITTVPQKIHNWCGINLKYFYPRQTIILPTILEGFKCNGKVEVTQQATFEEGSGYDLKQLEYQAKGWTESPYRLSALNGVAQDTKEYNTDAKEKYTQYALTYDQHSIGAWLDYSLHEATIIAVPNADTVTKTALTAVFTSLKLKYGN